MIEIKKIKHVLKVKLIACVLLSILLNCNTYSQKQFTHTATKANNNCNGFCAPLDIPELNNNPVAIIWVTPILENGINLNPHPIGVYYFKNQWNIFNLDQAGILQGAKFTVEYVTDADQNHFQYRIKDADLLKEGSAYLRDGSAVIDHPALNNNPNAKFISFLGWKPEVSSGANREEISQQYNSETGKWHISSVNKKPLSARVTYNIIISEKGSASYKAVQISEVVIKPDMVIPQE